MLIPRFATQEKTAVLSVEGRLAQIYHDTRTPPGPASSGALTSAGLGYSSALLDGPCRVDVVWPDYYQLRHVHAPQRLCGRAFRPASRTTRQRFANEKQQDRSVRRGWLLAVINGTAVTNVPTDHSRLGWKQMGHRCPCSSIDRSTAQKLAPIQGSSVAPIRGSTTNVPQHTKQTRWQVLLFTRPPRKAHSCNSTS